VGLSREPVRDSLIAPFDPRPDPRFFFDQSSHGTALDELLEGIQRRSSILVVTGEAGSGKSTVCGAVLQALNRSVLSAFLPEACSSREELLKTLLVDFGIVSADTVHHGQLRNASRTQLRYTFHDFLSSLVRIQAYAVVVIDEAHRLSAELLHEIHLLSALEVGRKLLVFVLVGQPSLKSHLEAAEMRQLAQRISIWTEIPALARKDVRAYVSYRLTAAGNVALHFTEAAIDMVYAASGGIPRVINLVCERALARVNHADTIVDAEDLLGAIADLHLPLSTLGRETRETKQESLGAVRFDMPRVPREPRPHLRGSLGAANPTAGRPAGAADGASGPTFSILRPHVRGMPRPQLICSDEEWVAAFKASARRHETRPAPAILPSPVELPAVANPIVSHPDAQPGASGQRPVAMFEGDAKQQWLRLVRSRPLVFASLTITTAVAALGLWVSRGSAERPSAETPPAQPAVSARPADPALRDDVASTSGAVDLAARPGTTQGHSNDGILALQMGTFQVPENAARTVEDLRSAGYRAYTVPLRLPSGKSAVGVFLGPYVDRAEAERDLRRTSRNPEYAGGHLVRIARTQSLKPPS
jgi:type II secretory pathway predicted ATPase ExeA/cell division septation protein DedD